MAASWGFVSRCALLVALALLAACEGHGVGTQCVFGTGGALGGGSVTGDCDDGLYCSTTSQTCTAPFPEGTPCDPRCNEQAQCNDHCEDGLICGLSLTCEPPGGEGARCTSADHCEESLLCNQGYLPDELQAGECHLPSTAGGPCRYTQYVLASSFTSGFGCDFDVVCTPDHAPTRDEISNTPTDETCPPGLVPCGFAGTCNPTRLAATGEPCLGDYGCVEGNVCYVIGHPKAATGTPGYDCGGGGSQDCYVGPWPGLCGPPGLPTRGSVCYETPCAPGHLCDRNGACQPKWSLLDGNTCDEWQNDGVQNDDFCGVGLLCRAGSPPRCQP